MFSLPLKDLHQKDFFECVHVETDPGFGIYIRIVTNEFISKLCVHTLCDAKIEKVRHTRSSNQLCSVSRVQRTRTRRNLPCSATLLD